MTKKIEDPIVAKYKKSLSERSKHRKQDPNRVQIPDLNKADAIFNPKTDGKRTITALGRASDSISLPGDSPAQQQRHAGFRDATIEGLKVFKQIADQQKAQKMAEKGSKMEETPDTPSKDPKAQESAPGGPYVEDKKQDALRIMDRMDSLELSRLLSAVEHDVINNEAERVKIEGVLDPIDIAEGLATGDFKQWVPIKKGSLEVHFRSTSGFENKEIRKVLFSMVADDPASEDVAPEIYSTMCLTASILQLNKSRMPSHLDEMSGAFNPEIFKQKLNKVLRYPTPLIHALLVHSYWFDQRVRSALKVDLGNG